MGHVLARLSGFGLVLLPHWPYSFEREREGSDAVRVTRWTPSGPVQAVVEPGQRVDPTDAMDVEPGSDLPYWQIETSVFCARWPADFTLESPRDTGDRTPFYLQGPGEATIFPQGPVPKARLASPDALVAPYQTVVARRTDDNGVTVVELTYEHDDKLWWQAHWVLPFRGDQLVVLTAQSLESSSERARKAAETVVASFQSAP
ncbi:hypothetical protein AB0J80_10570 [Actinoplanes sp. NPDC049548]|uniref:hypothetical protein n=1 Tax=Actinoplanes sp. NPDC049548 TaxID=3155152 RepID=UPI0034456464